METALGIRLMAVVTLTMLAAAIAPVAYADNLRMNNGAVAHIYALQQLSGCPTELRVSPQLRQAAQWHALDLLNNPVLHGDTGSDGSTPQDRAVAAGYQGQVAETMSINPASMANSALAANGIDIINQWQSNPAYLAIMTNCANTQIGVWSENSLDRVIIVAVYGPGGQ
ncbi:CAP domain-containing protein [Mycobacterium sp. URHB0044]|uniref:CAP domain-containing protein n=1 Tax=Mycobacterium sp. URHB0044 TaxID=1380386 RepID=UPI00055E0A22|nr:CAP domain-containing protein [Mycobacterium sp. URHB0044]